MDKLQLAVLTQWAEDAGLHGIQGRKRMQKVVYLLQQAGCPITADYTLHHYGPYSRDVANITDVMVAEGLLAENAQGQYDYSLGEQTRPMIEQAVARRGAAAHEFEAFHRQAVELLKEDLWTLELGSTILYFVRTQKDSEDWEAALQGACRYKQVPTDHADSQKAMRLAQQIAGVAA